MDCHHCLTGLQIAGIVLGAAVTGGVIGMLIAALNVMSSDSQTSAQPEDLRDQQ